MEGSGGCICRGLIVVHWDHDGLVQHPCACFWWQVCNEKSYADFFTRIQATGGRRWGLEGLELPNFQKGGAEPLQNYFWVTSLTVSERSKYSNRTVKHFNRAVRHCNRTVKYSTITFNCKIIIINGTTYKNNQQKQEIIMLSDAISEHLFFKIFLGYTPAPLTFFCFLRLCLHSSRPYTLICPLKLLKKAWDEGCNYVPHFERSYGQNPTKPIAIFTKVSHRYVCTGSNIPGWCIHNNNQVHMTISPSNTTVNYTKI